MMNMMMNAVAISEVRQGNRYPVGETVEIILEDSLREFEPKTRYILERRTIKRLARSLNINFSETQMHNTLMKNLNTRLITVLDSGRGLGLKFGNIHESAFGLKPHGEDMNRQVRQPKGQRSDNKDMNQRGKAGVYTRNLDRGLHLEDRWLCDCGTTFHAGSSVCRECGTTLDKSRHKTTKRPTTRNHTQAGEHLVVFLDSSFNYKVGVRRVEFPKGGANKARTKAGNSSRSYDWTSGKWFTMGIEGTEVEQRFGVEMTLVSVFVTNDCLGGVEHVRPTFNYSNHFKGGDE